MGGIRVVVVVGTVVVEVLVVVVEVVVDSVVVVVVVVDVDVDGVVDGSVVVVEVVVVVLGTVVEVLLVIGFTGLPAESGSTAGTAATGVVTTDSVVSEFEPGWSATIRQSMATAITARTTSNVCFRWTNICFKKKGKTNKAINLHQFAV